jgi:23S rRNA (uridine2552-2'-O)-methyltransferase
MSRSKTSKAWMHQHVNDVYVQRSKREGWRSRAAYKLLEIDAQDTLFRAGQSVVDLGSTPGGWSQVAASRVGPQGRVIALDRLEMEAIEGVSFIRGDFTEESVLAALETALDGSPLDLVISDMAPNLTGVAATDQARAAYLNELALEFAGRWLKPGGALLVKAFHGREFESFRAEMRGQFGTLVERKPEASRDRSSEVYLLGKGLRGK